MTEKSFYERVAEIQANLKAPKNQFNKFGGYKYRSLEDIQEGFKKISNGLILNVTYQMIELSMPVSFQVKAKNGMRDVICNAYVLANASITDGKEKVESTGVAGIDFNRPGMDVAQSFGSSCSYAGKYACGGLLLLDDTKDADTTNAHGKSKPKAEPAKPAPRAPAANPNAISEAQRKRLFAIGKSHGLNAAELKAITLECGFESSKDITKAKYEEVTKAIENYKILKENTRIEATLDRSGEQEEIDALIDEKLAEIQHGDAGDRL
tara:strand:+ start:28193 stop:28990 length:798 start_codon:yes stop_codon:yes gene_type:complete